MTHSRDLGYLEDLLASLHASRSMLAPAQLSPGIDVPDALAEQVIEDLDLRVGEVAYQAPPSVDSALADDERASEPRADAVESLRDQVGELWPVLSPRAQGALIQADRLRDDLADYYSASGDPEGDFALAVIAYSRALEIELDRRIFSPFLTQPALEEWEPMSSSARRSFMRLQAFRAGVAKIGMGDMAFILKNLGCPTDPPTGNTFGQYLQDRLVDAEAFCATRYPSRLIELSEERNKAAHVSELTLAECVEVRRRLLEEPTRLLLVLAEQAPIDEAGEPELES